MQRVPRNASPATQIPLNIEQTAATYQLGTPGTTYRNSSSLLFGGAAWLVYLGIIFTIIFFYSPDLNRTWWGWLLWSVFILLILLGIRLFLAHAAPLRVFVYPEGLIYNRKNQPEVIRWDQVEAYWEDARRMQAEPEYPGDKVKSYSYRVQRTDGATFEFPSDIAQIENLGRLIKQNVDQHLLPRTLAAYHAGTPISFGDINVDQQEIRVGSGHKTLPWSEFESFDLDEVVMDVYRKGQQSAWYHQSVAKIANPGVLQRLLDSIEQERVRQQLPRAIATYRMGSPVVFGRLNLSLQGIAIDGGKQSLPWSQVARLYVGTYIGGDRLTIIKKGKVLPWQSLLLSQLGDVKMLEELIEHIISVRP